MTARLLANADSLAPEIEARAGEIESARRIPKDLSQKMARAGFYRMFAPEALGGLEVSPADAARVFERLARADASCGWVAFIGATSASMLALLPDDAARTIFATPETMIAGVVRASGRADVVAGGFNVNGRWQWGSGSENADWVFAGCELYEDGRALTTRSGAPRSHLLALPARDIEFLDTWRVAGLRGTGSTDFAVRDLFVPEAHAAGYLVRDNPPRPLYQFPLFPLLALGIGAVALGVARAALDELIALASGKVRSGSSNAIANRPHTQMQVAVAQARLRSARAFFFETIDAAWQTAVAGKPATLDQRRDMRLAITQGVQASVEVVDAMYTLAGGTSVYETSRLQRQFRDVHVITQHVMVAPSTLETVGRLYLGVETNTSML